MTDDDLAALCIFEEAQGEPLEGKVAVGCVIRNRVRIPYASDGTIPGAVEHRWAFSWDWAQMEHGVYTQIVFDQAQAQARAEALLPVAQASAAWPDCVQAWADSAPGSGFVGGPQFQKLDGTVVLYCNPAISSPSWAVPDKFVAQVYHHSFYRG